MPDIIKDTRDLRTKEAAHYIGLSARTLEKHRTYGTGPAYRKVGGRVLYALEDLRGWADRGACASTSDPRSEEHTSELQSLMRISYAVFCLKHKKTHKTHKKLTNTNNNQ